MMLFEVKTNKYKTFYTFANSYDEAKDRIEKEIINEDNSAVLDKDGDLKTRFDLDYVTAVTCLENKLIK